jgi:phage gpG-like protein
MTINLAVKTRPIEPKYMKEALITAGKIVQADAKLTAPVDTGRLRGSISFALENKIAVTESPATLADGVTQPDSEYIVKVGTNVEYAAHVEYMQGGIYAYLRRALYSNINRIKAAFEEALKRSVEG